MKNVDDKNNKIKASNKNIKKNNNKNVQNKTKKTDAKIVEPAKKVHDEGVRVKEIKVTTVDDFYEEEDKKLIVIIAIAILIIMATIVGLLVGCEKKEEEEPKKPKEEVVIPVDDIVTDKDEEKEETVKKVTVKTEAKEEEVSKTKYYNVKFLLEDQTFKYLEVEENTLVNPFVPKGYNTCSYYKTSELKEDFNFKNRINEDTIIYTVCTVDNYTIEYDVETNNITEYNTTLGNVALEDAVSLESDLPFLGWYVDPDFTGEEITELSIDLLKYADENKVIRLYARFDLLNITYLNNEDVELGIDDYWPNETVVREDGEFSTAVCGNDKLLGWTSTKYSKVINYKQGEIFDELKDHLDLYPVCGKVTVVYTSEDASVSMGYTSEDLEEYELPQPSDVELDTPTYFIPVEEETENSKKVVPNEAIEILENEIKLQDAIDKAGTNYIPEVGDNVEEHNKVFVGWIEKEELPPVVEEEIVETEESIEANEDEIIEEETIIPEIEVLPEDYVPTEENTELEAVWREQTEEELESGIYDIIEEESTEVIEEEIEVVDDLTQEVEQPVEEV